MTALEVLLTGLIDYAGLYPPAGLDMRTAVRNYLSYCHGKHATALGRFLVDIHRLAELREVIEIPALRLNSIDGIDTTVVAFTTDIPAFGGQWGEPFLIGPGSIHVAHTAEERIPKSELTGAVDIYARMVRQLLTTGAAPA